jgi:membrane protein
MPTPAPRSPLRALGRRLSVVALDLVRGMRTHGALDSARLMAFNFFLSVIPLLVLLGYVLGRLVRRAGVEALFGPLFDTIPSASADIVRHELERLAGAGSVSIAPLSAVTFLWLTSSGIHQMMDVFEAASHARRRPWWKQRLIALATVGVGFALASVTAWALVTGDDVIHEQDTVDVTPAPAPAATHASTKPARGSRLPQTPARAKKHHLLGRVHGSGERFAAGVVVLAAGLVALAAFYRFAVEHPPGIRRRSWPGALAAMTAWLVFSWLFGAYIGSLGAYAVYYGSLAAVAVLLVWLYMTSLALLLGAEVNAMLEHVGAHE